MRVSTTSTGLLRNRSSKNEKEPKEQIRLKTYELNDYLNQHSFLDQGFDGYLDQEAVSNLQLSPEVKDMLKEKFWRTWYHLKHVQAGPFAVYNNPTPIDVGGLFPVTAGDQGVNHSPGDVAATEQIQMVPGVPVNTAQGLVAAGAMAPAAFATGQQVQVLPGVGPVTVTPQVVTHDSNDNQGKSLEELNRSLDTKAVPTDLAVTASQSGDPNTPPLANVPVVNVIGGKTISAPGVIPSEVMDKHHLFSTNNLAPNEYYKFNVENIGRTIIVVVIVLFLVLGCVYRIKNRKKPKKKR